VFTLGREVTDAVGQVTTPEGDNTFFSISTGKAVHHSFVRSSKTAGFEHLGEEGEKGRIFFFCTVFL